MNGEEWRKRICMETDTGYSYSLAKRMEQYRTNPVLGYRTAGSRAEFETGEMLVREMESLGLSDVHKDRICVDSGPDKLEEEAIRNLIFICMKQQCILRMERLGGLLLHSLKNINLSYRS